MATPEREEKVKRVMGARDRGVRVVLEDIHDPHNAAAIMRSCDGLGVQDVWFIFDQEKKYNPKRVGKASSSSANVWLDFRVFDSAAECFAELKQDGFTTYATVLRDADFGVAEADFAHGNVALLLGNEHRGLSAYALENSNHRITIPMRGFVESFNVSVAAALFLYEITRQRRPLR